MTVSCTGVAVIRLEIGGFTATPALQTGALGRKARKSVSFGAACG